MKPRLRWQELLKLPTENEEGTQADAATQLSRSRLPWTQRSDYKQAELYRCQMDGRCTTTRCLLNYLRTFFLGNGHYVVETMAGADKAFTNGLTAAEKGLAISAPAMIKALNSGVKHEALSDEELFQRFIGMPQSGDGLSSRVSLQTPLQR